MVMGAESPYQPLPQVDLQRILRETSTSILANERTNKRIKHLRLKAGGLQVG